MSTNRLAGAAWLLSAFLAVVGFVFLGALGQVAAAPLAYEGFSDGVNGADLDLYSGGTATGLSGTWLVTGAGAAQVDTINRAVGPLLFPSNVTLAPSQSGSNYQWAERTPSPGTWDPGYATRTMDTPLNFAADGEYYMSFLARIHANDTNMMVGLSDGTDLLTTGINYYAGQSRFGFSYGPTPPGTNTPGSADSGLSVLNGHVYFVVARLQTSAAGSDTISYKAYETSGAVVHGDPSQLSGVGAGPNQWTMQQTVNSSNVFTQLYAKFDGPGYPNFDEVRVGATWADVTSLDGWTPAAQSAGRKVGFNFVGGVGGGVLNSGELAGATGIDQLRWNNLYTDWQGNSGAVPVTVVDNEGNMVGIDNSSALGLRVEYDSQTVWGTGIGSTTPNERLMRGYLDDHPSDPSQPYINLTNLPFERYNVAVYVDGDQTNGVDGEYWLESLSGTQLTNRVYARDINHFSGTFTQVPVTSTDQGSAVTGNYILFEGLTDRDIRIRGSRLSSTRAPINAVQVIDAGDPVVMAPNPVVGLNFVGGGPSPGSVAAGEVAGASGYAQQNWNNLNTDWSGNGGAVPGALVDGSGATVGTNNNVNLGMAIQYDTQNTWGNGIADSLPNQRLMRGYLDSNSGDTSQPYLIVRNTPYNKYDVVLYVDGDVTAGELGQYWVETTSGTPVTPKVYARDTYNFNGRFARVPVTSTVEGSAPEGNYIVFEDLDLLDFRVRASQPSGGIRAPLNAVQLVSKDVRAMARYGAIGFNFVGGGGSPGGGTLAAGEVTGASGFAQDHWNNLSTDWFGEAGAVPATVYDNRGNVVGVNNLAADGIRVEYDSSNVWGNGIPGGTPDQRLMRGYLDSNTWQAGQPYVNVLNVPYGMYDVVLYVDGDVTDGELGQYWLETLAGDLLTPKVYAHDMYNFGGRFTEVPLSSTVEGSAPVGNFFVFENLTEDAFRIRGQQPSDAIRAPINAFQIMEVVPEPSAVVLAAVALAALAGLAWQRRRVRDA